MTLGRALAVGIAVGLVVLVGQGYGIPSLWVTVNLPLLAGMVGTVAAIAVLGVPERAVDGAARE